MKRAKQEIFKSIDFRTDREMGVHGQKDDGSKNAAPSDNMIPLVEEVI